MKVTIAALAILLCIATLRTHVFSAPVGADTPAACCFSYTSRQIPFKFIATYYETNSQCSKPGIIFLTKKDRQVCANPSDAWVQEYISNLGLNTEGVQGPLRTD